MQGASGSVDRRGEEREDSIGLSCVPTLKRGLVIKYVTPNMTTSLGFTKDMWIGRSFLDFLHSEDRDTFMSEILNEFQILSTDTSGRILNIESGVEERITNCTLGVRIRQYKTLSAGYGVKERDSFLSFLLKFSFKTNEEDENQAICLHIKATPIYSAYTTPNESVSDAIPFAIQHSNKGIIQYIAVDCIPYLGYCPQDLVGKDVLLLYHPDDLPLLKEIYEITLKDSKVFKSMPFRMLAKNGEYVKVETEWVSCVNPWSKKLEFVIGKHSVVMGPVNPDVFWSPPLAQQLQVKLSEEENTKMQVADFNRESIRVILQHVASHRKREHKLINEENAQRPPPAELKDSSSD